MKKTTTKKGLWFVLINAVGWVWCSYALAYLGRVQIAETLSKTAVEVIIAVFFTYCAKSLLEKREKFGAVGAAKPAETERETLRDL